MDFGEMQIDVVSGGNFWIDGGNIFGVVPKVLWARLCPPDESNRIFLETNCTVVRANGRVVLIDTGYGSKATTQQKRNFRLQDGLPIVENLEIKGIRPTDIDFVILTHLHFDHAGGCTFRRDDGQTKPTFPNAVHVVQRIEWEDANADLPELAGAYNSEDFRSIADASLFRFVDGEEEVVPGVTVRLTGGHTRGHQVVYLRSGDNCVVCPADLCPLASHVHTPWTMAYDQFPLTTRIQKHQILLEAANEQWVVLFDHDSETKAALLAPDEKKTFAPTKVLVV
jgi:glyoxylase-like metal-dependent hydrolase (beta-lactamase superfamily II)